MNCLRSLTSSYQIHRHTGPRLGAATPPPPSLVKNINWSGNFSLRVGQFSCLGFVSLIFLIFSFHSSPALCRKTHSKMQEMALTSSRGAYHQDPPRGSHAFGTSDCTFISFPLKFLSPYAYNHIIVLTYFREEK